MSARLLCPDFWKGIIPWTLCRTCFRHRGGKRHPQSWHHQTGRYRRQHRQSRLSWLWSHGCDLPGCRRGRNQSRGIYPAASNGGEALLTIARHYFGTFGAVILAVTVTFACLKTAVGLITSCSQTFCQLFPRSFSYRVWATGLLYLFLRRSESGSGNHHRLGFACTDVSLPAGHHADPAGPGRKMV